MKKIVYFFIIFLLLTSCTSPKYKDLKDGIYANIETNKGDILLELYANDVPKTVANFISLVEGTNTRLLDSLKGENFYEGIIFHRVVPNFVIQAGGYTSKGRKIAGYLFGDEFPIADNGDYIYKHDDQGILSMANGGPKTNNSQFFITHRAIPHLNGKHSVFGKTTVNSLELKELQKKYTDSLQLKKAIDSTRMAIVNKIVQNDTINTIKIIRIGAAAKEFDAASVFNEEEADFEKSQQAKINQENKREEKRYAKYLVRKKAFLAKMNVSKAKETGTGLRILMLKETKGKKVTENKPITANYTLYIADGKRMQSSSDVGKPVVFNLKDEQNPMISGLREGLLTMREGEKARFFIPYSIAFGDQKAGPFPAKSDLIYEIEILKIGK
ncbi:peptidylprolyl isomerase [Polaribacter aestuariivivens]|uniref:peptidylprolyl isomerase n=1 Tax=Polaribacter aestuariivivens TaxID=2304626 RepID=A0A5S3N7D5_9FLAO|nr:peptidylprolyl isomerase [Polaribacter aestuariivivens]TMM31057.1 peptidylprolyl isomerase [Polaribacter aestuariivivens]